MAKIKTEEEALAAVRQNAWLLGTVPKNLRTTEIYIEAIRQGACALNDVPKNLITAEVCLEAVRQNGYVISDVPEKFMTVELCIEALKDDGRSLQYVPEKFMTAEMCIEAVKKNGNALLYVPEKLREEVRSNLESVEYQPPKTSDMAEIKIGAQTGEEIRFEFDKLTERELNSVSPTTPYRNFSVISDFVADNINVFVTIPDHREVPKSITLKLTIIGKSAEHREAAINCSGRVSKAGLGGIVILHASEGRPRNGYKYRQKAEITLNFENRNEALVCPVSGTTTFGMCFYDAYEAQKGKPDSVGGSINEFTE